MVSASNEVRYGVRAVAEIARARLARIDGIADPQIEKQVRIPQLEIILDHTKAALYGLQPQAITEQLERLSDGRVVSRLFDGTRRFNVVLWLSDGEATACKLDGSFWHFLAATVWQLSGVEHGFYPRYRLLVMRPQCENSVGTVICRAIWRVAPPNTNSRNRECP